MSYIKEKVVEMANCKNWEDIPSGLCFSKKQIEEIINLAEEKLSEDILVRHYAFKAKSLEEQLDGATRMIPNAYKKGVSDTKEEIIIKIKDYRQESLKKFLESPILNSKEDDNFGNGFLFALAELKNRFEKREEEK